MPGELIKISDLRTILENGHKTMEDQVMEWVKDKLGTELTTMCPHCQKSLQTAPAKQIKVVCPKCGKTYETANCHECPFCMHNWDEKQ